MLKLSMQLINIKYYCWSHDSLWINLEKSLERSENNELLK